MPMEGQLIGSWQPCEAPHGCAWLGLVTTNRKQVQIRFM